MFKLNRRKNFVIAAVVCSIEHGNSVGMGSGYSLFPCLWLHNFNSMGDLFRL